MQLPRRVGRRSCHRLAGPSLLLYGSTSPDGKGADPLTKSNDRRCDFQYALAMGLGSIGQCFISSVDADLQPAYAAWPKLQESLEAVIRAAREQWPDIEVEALAYVEYLAKRATCEVDLPELPSHAGDLYLACACLAGNPQALQYFESDVLRRIDSVLVRLGIKPHDADDIRQELRERLLVGGNERAPALGSYLGTGALVHWIRAVAGRQALASLRRTKPTTSIEDEILEDSSDLQLAGLKQEHYSNFKSALHKSVAKLSSRDREILQALIVDDRSVAEIAVRYKVHRVTASRWIAKIRKDLFRFTRAELRAELDLTESELQSMIGHVESQMEMSLARVLTDE